MNSCFNSLWTSIALSDQPTSFTLTGFKSGTTRERQGAGCRAMGELGVSPRPVEPFGEAVWYDVTKVSAGIDEESNLPRVWFTYVNRDSTAKSVHNTNTYFRSTVAARDSAANAWLLLTDAERTAILFPTLTAGAV